MQKLLVEQKDDGKKLITYISSKYPRMRIATLQKALRQKDIKVNGKRVSKDLNIYFNDEITIYISDELLLNNINKKNINIVFEDENIVIFNKPADIEVEGQNSLTELYQNKYTFLKPCHRIDRNTTGLVLFAKNIKSLELLEKAFRQGNVEKHYIACCYGIPNEDKTSEAFLFKDRKKSIVYISNNFKKGYSRIKTSYKLIEKNIEKNISLLDITLHTGKTHQIRAHLAFLGYPIIGDGKYGSNRINKKFGETKQALCSYSFKFKSLERKS